MLKGVKSGSDVLIVNTQYVRSRKKENGTYSPDFLYIVYKDIKEGKKKLQIITNPHIELYTTKGEFQNSFNTPRDDMPLERLDKHSVPYKQKETFLYKKLKDSPLSDKDRIVKMTIDEAKRLGKWSGRKEIHKWRHAYSSDIDIEDYVYITANLHYEPSNFTLNKSFLDIETDIFGSTHYQQDNGMCPVTAITMIYDYSVDGSKNYKPKVFTFLLRNHDRYKGQAELEENMDEFMGDVHKEFDKKYGDADYKIVFYDDEAKMIYDALKIQHLMKPDITGIFNMSFDIIYLQKRAEYLGLPSDVLFCHPDFKNVYTNFHLDERYFNDFKNRGDSFTCLSYTKYLDQMLTYASRRKGGQDYGANNLDNISNIELNAEKRRYDDPGVTIYNAAIREYRNFTLYSINDVWLQVGLERKTGDLDDVFIKGYESGTRVDKANRSTLSLKNLWSISYFQQGYAMCNNINANYLSFGEDSSVGTESTSGFVETLKGALVGDPTNLNFTGANIYGDRKSNRLFLDDIDLDFEAMYPNAKLKNNITRSSQYGRLIMLNKISHLEYSVNEHLRGGEFVEDYETGDWIKNGIKWFSLKRTEEYIREFVSFSKSKRTIVKLKKIKRRHLYTLWSQKMRSVFTRIFPNKESLIDSFLGYIFKRDLVDSDCLMYNNYEDIEYTTTLLGIMDWIHEARPILTESGTFFKRHEESEINPGLKTIDSLLKQRKVIKNLELEFEKAGKKEEARLCNLKQNRKKTYVNSEYGASGNVGAFSYNFHISQSVTSKGQTLISLAMTTFEEFLSDTIQFYDMDELLSYCDNIVTEKRQYSDSEIIHKNKTIDEVKERLLSKCKNIKNLDEGILNMYLSNISSHSLNRLYYKSNLFAFIDENPYIQTKIGKFSINTPVFMNPNRPPDESIKRLNKITNIVLEYCQYNYPFYGRIDRLINLKRNCVLVIDTDSNIISIHDLRNKLEYNMPDYLSNQIIRKGEKNYVKEERKIKAINIGIFIITEVIARALFKFEEATNVTESTMGRYLMKNEFYYDALLCQQGKKRYMGPIRMREGNYYKTPKRDVKGLDFKKLSFASKFVSDYIEDTLFEYIVTENINIPKALNKFIKLEDIIRKSLTSGSKEYLNQAKVKTEDSYKDDKAMSQGTFKGVYIWNSLYPESEITIPNSVYLVKVQIKSIKDIASLALDDKPMFDKIIKLLEEKEMRTGITQIAIPLDEEVPKWIINYMNIETMVSKNLSLVTPILKEIGVQPVYRVKSEQYLSNIVQLG